VQKLVPIEVNRRLDAVSEGTMCDSNVMLRMPVARSASLPRVVMCAGINASVVSLHVPE
jgi:hypothetical protein